MTDRATVEQLLNALYAARMNGPVDQLASLFAPGVHFRIAGTSDGKPIAITADGIQAVRPWLAMLVKTFRVCDHQRLLTLVEGDHAAVHWSATIHSRITGARSVLNSSIWCGSAIGRLFPTRKSLCPTRSGETARSGPRHGPDPLSCAAYLLEDLAARRPRIITSPPASSVKALIALAGSISGAAAGAPEGL